jgi:hypothetical protein
VPLDSVVVGRLIELLQDCTAWVKTPKGLATGFFIEQDLVLTSGHVVGDGQGMTVLPFGESEPRPCEPVPPQSATEVDVALLRVSGPRADQDRPVVLLDLGLTSGAYHLAGYPKEALDPAARGLEVLPVQAHSVLHPETRQPTQLRIEPGQQIKPGLSGGPLLSEFNGAVVAFNRYSENPDAALGGAAVPISLVAALYPEVDRVLTVPPAGTRPWRELLGRTRWESLGHVWNPEEQLDILLTGDRTRWRIGLRTETVGQELSVRDLGDELAEMLVQWAQHRQGRSKQEVELLGRLLSTALLPGAVADHLPPPDPGGGRDEPFLIRLHLDPSGPLTDLPWEFALVPGSTPARFVATEESLAFTRVVAPGPGPEAVIPREPPGDRPTVLAVVVQPAAVQPKLPAVAEGPKTPYPWPPVEALAEQLTAAVRATGTLDLDLLVNPELFDLQERIGERRYDVIHYLGFGIQEGGGNLAFSDGAGDLAFHECAEVFDSFQRAWPRVVVLQFALPPYDLQAEPITPCKLAGAFGAGVEAVVCSRPVHWRQYERFNKIFYDRLGRGRPIEAAVQGARNGLRQDKRVDFAGFGWFSLLTGPRPRVTLIPEPDPNEAKQGAAAPAPAVTRAAVTPSPSADLFGPDRYGSPVL